MPFSDVPGATVSRQWAPISVLYSNLFRFRGLSRDNQFRITLAVGFNGFDGIPVIVSQAKGFVFQSVWQEVMVPLSVDYKGKELYIYARISDTQWGARGSTQFLLQEGESMIYDSSNARDIISQDQIVGEAHGMHAPVAALAPGASLVIPPNPKRRRGFIQNLLTNPVFVYFSSVANSGGDKQTARVAKGARIDIPEKYVGTIVIDVKGQFSADASLLSSVQYLAAEDI